mmetsp:Transcript_20005/g.46278  ORF Transcript_20005/g.46278 Transcript_20005/m.46278 type:complete len:587 (-) Transcript_20005:111-1871(-)
MPYKPHHKDLKSPTRGSGETNPDGTPKQAFFAPDTARLAETDSDATRHQDAQFTGPSPMMLKLMKDPEYVLNHTHEGKEIPWYGDADAIRALPRKVELKFEPIEVDTQFHITKLHAEEVSHEEASRRQGIIEVKTEKAVEALGRPITKLRDGINWCIQQGKYSDIKSLLDFTKEIWPINEYELMKAMEPAMLTCCERNDAYGLHVLTVAAGHLPEKIVGEALYQCAMRGNTEAGSKIIGFTNGAERRRSLFRCMELRHPNFVCLMLENDPDRTLLDGISAASGGAHTLLGHALELAAEYGHIPLTSAVLGHMFDKRVHVVPRNNDPRKRTSSQTERAHHWCWPHIIRSRHIAAMKGYEQVSTLLANYCHDQRPSRPNTAQMVKTHGHVPHMSRVLGNHQIHRTQRKWHPSMAPQPPSGGLSLGGFDFAGDDNQSLGASTIGTMTTMGNLPLSGVVGGSIGSGGGAMVHGGAGPHSTLQGARQALMQLEVNGGDTTSGMLANANTSQRSQAQSMSLYESLQSSYQSLKDDDVSVEKSRFYGYGGPFQLKHAEEQKGRMSQMGSREGDPGELVLKRDTTTAGLLGFEL